MIRGNRGQAWLTSVSKSEESMTMALVLAESLRRSRTTKRIGVIINLDVGTQKAQKLQKVFDDVFLVNDNLILPLDKLGKDEYFLESDFELRAKIFAFSLEIYKQAIYLSPNHMVLENCDKLFDDECFTNVFNRKCDSMFHFAPNWTVCQFLKQRYDDQGYVTKNHDNNFIVSNLKEWFKNNEINGLSMETNDQDVKTTVAKFSLKTGKVLMCGMGLNELAVVQFVDQDMLDADLVTKMEFLLKTGTKMGLLNQVIIRKWLEIYQHQNSEAEIYPIMKGARNGAYESEPIAIIGMSCRFPGANNLEEFWNLLYDGLEGVGMPPSFRWSKEHSIFGGSNLERKTRAGFLAVPVDEFDAKFFGISPKEALFLDPQARLMHELVWEGLENSGIDPHNLRGSHTGIFTGSWMNDYKDIVQSSTEKEFFRTYTGNSIGASAARLSFLLGTTGPSIATESGCSSAIVAVDLAVKSLRNGESNLALASGVNLLLHPFKSDIIDFVISPDGRCKTFDANANGFARAEGCGVLVLKRLSDALRDRDNIWAMIRGSAISQEGLSRSLGTPTVHCEALAMKLALDNAGVLPEQVSFVESHGTGTSVGDPMEIAAINQTYGGTKRSSPLVIGSVKTNVGHTESCSGITGIIKTVLAMQNEVIPKHLNLETINPQINLDVIPATIPLESMPWLKREGIPRLAGVSSFGITGTDGHVILQEPPDYELPKIDTGLERPLHIMKFSAKTEESLDKLIGSYESYFSNVAPNIKFHDVAFTANTGRASFNHRAFILASDYEQALKSLQDNNLAKSEARAADKEKICFLFTGQGSQYSGMAKSLYDTSPVFRIHFDYCDRLLRDQYNLSIINTLWGDSRLELNRTIYSQTSIFCIEYCLLKLWESWSIKPDYILGHSLGEFCAVVAAGIISFEDALKLVVTRSRLIDQLEAGSMLVIKASLEDVERLMEDASMMLDIAAVNSSEQTVVAGDTAKILQLMEFCKSRTIKAVKLEATHAFHSRYMEPILDEYRKVAEKIKISKNCAPNCQYISGMDGKLIEDPAKEINAEYWVHHTRKRVSFLDACTVMQHLGCQNYLEIGPQPVLSTFAMQNIELSSPINCLPSLRRNTNDWDTILTSLGKLYLQGYPINWEGFDKPFIRKKISSLPTYPFQRKSFWVDCINTNVTPIHPLIGHPISNASALKLFENSLSLKSAPYLKDHCIGNRIVIPAAAFAEMCLSAGYCVTNSVKDNWTLPSFHHPMGLENLTIMAPLELKESNYCRIQVIVDIPLEDDKISAEEKWKKGLQVKVFHQNNSDGDTNAKWILHATATFHLVISTTNYFTKWNNERIAVLMQGQDLPITNALYKRVSDVGLKFGESFKTIQKHWRMEHENGSDEVLVEMKIPSDSDKYIVHPIIIDAMLQTAILTQIKSQTETLRVPVSIGQLTWLSNVEPEDKCVLYMHAWWADGKLCILALNESLTTPVAYLTNLEMIETNVKTIESVLEQQNNFLPDFWEEKWKPILGPHDKRVEQPKMEAIWTSEEFSKELEAASTLKPGDWNRFNQINRLIFLYMFETLLNLGWNPSLGENIIMAELCSSLKILPEYFNIVQFYFSVFRDENKMEYIETEDNWQVKCLFPSTLELQTEIGYLENEFIDQDNLTWAVKFYHNIAQRLPQILIGNESPLQFLFPTDPEKQEYSAEKYYQFHPGRPDGYSKLLATFKTLFQKYREKSGEDSSKMLRVLEVGAGTGSISHGCLSNIKEHWGNNFEYYYTDISAAFFPKAEKKLVEFKDNIKFSIYNIEENALAQGIPLNYFDVVVCQDVIHITKKLHKTVRNLKAVIRPGGCLLFTEIIIEDRGVTFTFGLLEGYWRFEDFELRKRHPCIEGDKWRRVLLECGFEFVHVAEAHYGTFGTMYAETPLIIDEECQTGLGNIISQKNSQWIIFSHENSGVMTNVFNKLQLCEENMARIIYPENGSNKLSEFDSILDSDNIRGIIYAWGLFNQNIDQTTIAKPLLDIIKRILCMKKPPRLYVLTNGVNAIKADTNLNSNPSAATLFGMVKSLKNESSDLFVRYIDLDNNSSHVLMAEQILYELAMYKEGKEKEREQISYRDGLRYEPKLTKSIMLKNHTGKNELKLPFFSEMYHLILPESKMIEDLKFDVLEKEEVEEGEVEIRIEAYALNFRDIVTVLKPTAEFEGMSCVGLDFAGVVTMVGNGVEGFKDGDRVFGINYKVNTALRSHLVLNTDHLVKMPSKMTFTEAATLPAVFATSLHCLVNVAQLKKGETVLIHTGSGGVGLSAIQIARIIGARIIATAGNERKRGYLRSLGIEHVFHSRNTSFAEEIMKVTGGQGVDVVLNSITGPGLKEASLRVCGKGCRFVEMSKLSIWTKEEVEEMRPDVIYTIVDLTVLERDRWVDLLDEMKQNLNEGLVKPLPHVIFDALHIRQALTYFLRATHIGKVVIRMARSAIKNGEWRTNVPLFNEDSTYIITGGLGGIGFEVCQWMLEKGATDIVLIGRRAPKPEVAEVINKLQMNKQLKIVIELGNVGDPVECRNIIESLMERGCKPIRGIHHCAGVLRDYLYSDQTWETYEVTFESKVKGTWNLHNLTRDMPLEHFVLYSSVSAVAGGPKQSNHAASNSFEDAFAHYRYSLGLPGMSINWGQWSQVGCAKEMNLPAVLPLSVKQALNGLEVVLQTHNVQVMIANFDSLETFGMICPTFRHILDERLLKSEIKQVTINLPSSDQFWEEVHAANLREGKIDVICKYVKVIVRGALRMDVNEPISEDANMQDLGVDSLMAIELKNSIQSLLGSRITIKAALLKDCTTIRELANVLVDKIYDDDEQSVEVDLTPKEFEKLLINDCLLDDDIQISGPPILGVTFMRNVLVTGATGQLGPYILSLLSGDKAYNSLDKIICLIRTKEGKCPKERLMNSLDEMNLSKKVDMSKIVCVRGDVALENFGLEKKNYDELCADVDGVIHLAVNSNHLEMYRNVENRKSDVRSVNVGGTLNVLRFAATTKTKYVYHAGSILSVVGKSEDGNLCDNWPENEEMKVFVDNKVTGYPTSKFVCEMLIKQAVERGLPCKVFRFPWITGERETGQVNYVNNHYILRFMSYLKIKLMPDAPMPALVLPVDICAELSLKLFWNDETPNEVFNIVHPNPQLEVDFVKIAKEHFGVELELVDWKNKEFAEKLYKTDMPLEPLKEIYADVDRGIAASKSLQAVQGYLLKPEKFFSNRKVDKHVPGFSFNWSSSMEIIKCNLEFARSKGFFDKFGI